MAGILAISLLGTLVLLVTLRALALRRRRAVSVRLDMLRELDGAMVGAAPGGRGGSGLGGMSRFWRLLSAACRGNGRAHAPRPAATAVVVASCLGGIVYAGWLADRSGPLWALVGGTALAALAWLVAGSAVEGAVRRRRARIARALSDWLDTVTCYVHVGMPFESAVGMAIRARIAAGKELKDEWFRYLQDTRLGTSRRDALVALARRCDSEELHRVIGAVMAAEDRDGLARGLHACALDLQAAQRSRRRARLAWRVLAVAVTALGMALAIGVL